MKVDFSFKGLMVPVFTPFMDDKHRSVNYEMIDKYAHYLKSKGMHGVMVLGMTGEGMCLTLDEHKRVADEWFKVTRKYDMKMVLNIGGMPLPDIYEFAAYAEKMMVDAVMVMPDLFYRPVTEEDLVKYIVDIYKYMPTRPLFYYHIPFMTHVYLNLYKFVDMMEKEVKTFVGLMYADDHIDKLVYLKEKKPEYIYIVAMYTSMMAYWMEGFEAFCMTGMNLYPEMVKEMYDYCLEYKMKEAYVVKEKYVKKIYNYMHYDAPYDYVYNMKMEMEKMYSMMKMGPVRKPMLSMHMWNKWY